MTTDTLDGMTQERWNRLSHDQRKAIQSTDGLTKQLIGLEGARVEVTDKHGETRRFIVGRSTGWKPCHLEIKTACSTGGTAADSEYARVTVILFNARNARR